MESILDCVKHGLGIDLFETDFDDDLIMHINSVFSILNELGVGPTDTYSIDDGDAVWSSFMESKTNLNAVKTYMTVKVRLVFDPPETSYAIAALERIAMELEWRLNVIAEGE